MGLSYVDSIDSTLSIMGESFKNGRIDRAKFLKSVDSMLDKRLDAADVEEFMGIVGVSFTVEECLRLRKFAEEWTPDGSE